MVITMKKTVLFLMVIVLMMGVCGCGMKTVTNERNNVVPFLQDKYEETFTLVSYEIRSMDIPYDEAVCTNALGQKVKVYIDYEDEHVVMTDDYYGILKMPQYSANLRAVLEEYNVECKMFTRFAANYFAGTYDHNTELSQAMAENTEQFYTRTFLFIPESTQIKENVFVQLRETLLLKNMTMYLAVYQVDENIYATIDENQEASVYIKSEDGVKPLYEDIIK